MWTFQIDVDTVGGYEFSGLVFIDQGIRTAANEADFEFLLAHELAHQWWYLLVGNDQVNEPWLDEALANYSVVRYLESLEGEQGAALLEAWRQQYGPRQPNDPPVDSSATEFAGWDAYRRTVYIHGALFLDGLEEQMGEEAFKELLNRYTADFRYGMGSTEAFLGTAQAVAKRDLSTYFQEWLSSQAISAMQDWYVESTSLDEDE